MQHVKYPDAIIDGTIQCARSGAGIIFPPRRALRAPPARCEERGPMLKSGLSIRLLTVLDDSRSRSHFARAPSDPAPLADYSTKVTKTLTDDGIRKKSVDQKVRCDTSSTSSYGKRCVSLSRDPSYHLLLVLISSLGVSLYRPHPLPLCLCIF